MKDLPNWLEDKTSSFRSVILFRVYILSILITKTAFQARDANIRLEHVSWIILLWFIYVNRNLRGYSALRIRSPYATIIFCWLFLASIVSLYFTLYPLKSLWILYQITVGIVTFVLLVKNPYKDFIYQQFYVVINFLMKFYVIVFLIYTFNLVPLSFNLIIIERLTGFSYEPNILGGMAMAWIGLMYIYEKGKPLSLASCINYSCATLVVLGSGTRAAMVSLIFFSFYVLIEKLKRQQLLPLMNLFLLAPVAVAVYIIFIGQWSVSTLSSNIGRITSAFDLSAQTFQYRLNVSAIAIQDIEDFSTARLLFGDGLNSFSQTYQIDISKVESAYLSNLFLGIVHDTGILGFLLFLSFILSLFHISVIHTRRSVVFWFSFFVCTFTTNSTWFVYTWVFIALAVRLNSNSSTETTNLSNKTWRIRN